MHHFYRKQKQDQIVLESLKKPMEHYFFVLITFTPKL